MTSMIEFGDPKLPNVSPNVRANSNLYRVSNRNTKFSGSIATNFRSGSNANNSSCSTRLKGQDLYSRVFEDSDDGHKGYLSRTDLKVAMVSLFGYKPCKYTVDELMGTLQCGMSKETFIALMTQKMAAVDKDEETREMFRAFDRESKGFLTVDDLCHATSKVAAGFPIHRIYLAFQDIDGDKDGRISFRDFEWMMKHGDEDEL